VLRLKGGNRLKVGEGVSRVKSGSSGAVVFNSRVSCNDGVDWYEFVVLAGRGFRLLGFWAINMNFKMSEGLLGSFARVLYSEVLCAFYGPTSSQFQPTSFRKHEKKVCLVAIACRCPHLVVKVWGRRGVEIGN